jgi:hypothetical protein
MRKWLLAGSGVVAAAALAGLAAVGLGGEGDRPASPPVRVAATHALARPPAEAAARTKAASLFKLVYKETNTLSVPDGVTPFDLRSCPRGGAVLSAWHIRIGDDKSGLVATGSTPVGVREMEYVVTNTTGGPVNGRLGLVCIK